METKPNSNQSKTGTEMTILFFTRLYYPHIGGVETHVQKIGQELKKLGHQVIIVTEQYDKSLKTEELIQGIKVYRIPVWNKSEKSKKWTIWYCLWRHRQLIKTADIVHIHDVFFWYLPFRFLYPFKKIFITFHGYEGSSLPKLSAIIHRKIAEILSANCICVGEFMKKWYYAQPKLITYGAANIKFDSLPQKLTAIFIGRLDQDTGIMVYLKALRLLRQKSIPLSLTVYGHGRYYAKAKDFCHKYHLPVEFKGFTNQAALKIKDFRFAFVSRYLSILEAMQAGRIVFAQYNNPIKQDYLACHPQAKNMIIFHSPLELAQAITAILKDPRQEIKMIKLAYQWASRQTWQKLTQHYLQLWQQKN